VGYAPVSNTRDNPPCNTLFIGNLGESADDNELQVLFGTQPVRAWFVGAGGLSALWSCCCWGAIARKQ
jgi:hypothetical protein